jgi:hypothetical protein
VITSSDDPAGKPQIILIGRDGYGSWASAGVAAARRPVSRAAGIAYRFIA